MLLKQQFLTKNRCYKNGAKLTPTGIVVHSTGSNNPNLKRYVQPDDGLLGVNQYKNSWNTPDISKCVHAFIGKLEDGRVAVYQTLPWEYKAWGVYKGSKGSYNNSHIQFEICEDGLTNEQYYTEAFQAAVELCVYLCKAYNIRVENIVGHYEAYLAGYGNNHADPQHWQKKFGDNMDTFRARVAAALGEKPPSVETPKAEASKPVNAQQTSTGNSTLREGSKGASVTKMQELLIKAGYSLPKYGADGHFGNETLVAVKEFQEDHGLTVDGICGPKTWSKLLEDKSIKYYNIQIVGSLVSNSSNKVTVKIDEAELKALIKDLQTLCEMQ